MTNLDTPPVAGQERAPAGRRHSADHPGPPPAAPLAVSLIALLAAVLSGPITGAGSVPPPTRATTGTVDSYFAQHNTVTELGAWLLALSAVAFVFFIAVLYSRLQFFAPNAPGPVLALTGGLAASGLLTMSAVLQWTLSRGAVTAQGGLTHALSYANFAAGGPVHVAALSVLMAGAAVTALFVRRTPRWLSLVGIALAVVDLVAGVSLIADVADFLVPIGRFASMAWLLAFSLLLPRRRAARGTNS